MKTFFSFMIKLKYFFFKNNLFKRLKQRGLWENKKRDICDKIFVSSLLLGQLDEAFG